MSEIFKLKVCIGDANIELEGDGTLVHTIFSELRENGLGKLGTPVLMLPRNETVDEAPATKIEEIIPAAKNENVDTLSLNQTSINSLPNIKDVVLKNLPKTEAEWVLVYALYASEEGNKVFTAEDIRQMYHTSNRFTDARNKNFATNIKKAVTSSWFITVNNTEYSLIEGGKALAYEILQRTSENGSSKKTKKTVNSAKATYNIVDLGLNQEQRQDIKQYLLSFPSVSNMDRAVLIAYKLTQYEVTEFNENTIFTALRIAELSAAYDLKGSLKNGKNNKNYYIPGETVGMYKLHHLGEDRAKELEKARGNE